MSFSPRYTEYFDPLFSLFSRCPKKGHFERDPWFGGMRVLRVRSGTTIWCLSLTPRSVGGSRWFVYSLVSKTHMVDSRVGCTLFLFRRDNTGQV